MRLIQIVIVLLIVFKNIFSAHMCHTKMTSLAPLVPVIRKGRKKNKFERNFLLTPSAWFWNDRLLNKRE